MSRVMTTLPDRLEEAEAGSRELDALIYSHLGCTLIPHHADDRPRRRWPDGSVTLQRKVTTSIDAAVALAERVLPGWGFYLRRDSDGSGCGLVPPGLTSVTPGHMQAVTPALALCAAILRAAPAMKGEG